jgi:hypothetical protein
MLRSKPGIVFAEVLPQRDGDAYSYLVESEVGIDISKSLFYTLAEKKWPLIGMEAMGMSLEDIFIAIVDQSAPKQRYERKAPKIRGKGEAETEIAKTITKKATKSTEERYSALFDSDNEGK